MTPKIKPPESSNQVLVRVTIIRAAARGGSVTRHRSPYLNPTLQYPYPPCNTRFKKRQLTPKLTPPNLETRFPPERPSFEPRLANGVPYGLTALIPTLLYNIPIHPVLRDFKNADQVTSQSNPLNPQTRFPPEKPSFEPRLAEGVSLGVDAPALTLPYTTPIHPVTRVFKKANIVIACRAQN